MKTWLDVMVRVAVPSIFSLFLTAGEMNQELPPSRAWGFDVAGMDRSVEPGDNFYRYANGKWADTTLIPADKMAFGSFGIVADLAEKHIHELVKSWASAQQVAQSDEAKVATLFNDFLNEEEIDRLDVDPIKPYLEDINRASTLNDMARLMAQSFFGFGRSFIDVNVSVDVKNPSTYAVYLSQADLGLPNRDYYLSEKFSEQKERYREHVATMLRLIGWEQVDDSAKEIVELESKMADAHWTPAESRNRDKTYNPITINELKDITPHFPWDTFFGAAKLSSLDKLIMKQNTAVVKLATIFHETSVATLKSWYAFSLVSQAAPYLSKRLSDENWLFYAKYLNGVEEQRPRYKRALQACEEALGDAIGRGYVARHFPSSSKEKMEELVNNLLLAMKGRIENLAWMSRETKERALEKLRLFRVKIGYPSKWVDYSSLEITQGKLLENMLRSLIFRWNRELDRLNHPVDREEWLMTPQTVNAYYLSSKNEIVFPAAILQPPFFDPNADPAVNYGAIGAVIGHEISHGFDDQGRKFDGTGLLTDWWLLEDANKFNAQAVKLKAQYESIVLPDTDLRINGSLTMGENIGDLGGVLLALDAYRLSPHALSPTLLDGFTDEQRFFLGWAQAWRTLIRPDYLRLLLVSDSHAPGPVRVFAPLRNIDAWYTAFNVQETNAHYIQPSDRVNIW